MKFQISPHRKEAEKLPWLVASAGGGPLKGNSCCICKDKLYSGNKPTNQPTRKYKQ